MYKLDVAYIYPDLLNNEGDVSNILVFKNRCKWRNIDVEITRVNPGDEINPNRYDFYFISGNEDEDQLLALNYLKKQSSQLKTAIDIGGVFLALKGGMQLFGEYIKYQNYKLDCLNLINFSTEMKDKKIKKNTNLKVDFSNSKNKVITGFTNNRGTIDIGGKIEPFSKEDEHSGLVYKNFYGSNLEGEVLALNYHFCDHLIKLCMVKKYGIIELEQLDDNLEIKVHKEAMNKG